jgi:hypothetical protein
MNCVLEYITKNPQETKRLIGIDYEQLQQLITQAVALEQQNLATNEQARERPKEYQEQKKFYSGKKKSHTLKNQLIVLPNGAEIVDVTVGQPGTSSDIKLFRARQSEFDANQRFKGDKGYIGEVQIETPHKKPKQQELTLEQKEENKQLSVKRIIVEHVIRLVKIFRVAQERFRLRPQNYERVILTVCGLVKLRVGALILPTRKPAESWGFIAQL